MRRIKHAKIVATLGPASDERSTIRALFDAGADVFRLNFSHGTRDVPEMSELASRTALKEGFGTVGQTVVISAGMPFGASGTTNLLRIAQI